MTQRKKSSSSDRSDEPKWASYFGKGLYFFIALVLLSVAVGIILLSLGEIWTAFETGGDVVPAMLDSIGLTVLALAVIDVSKYLLDEEVLRERELRAPREARGALTKFMTIVAIAVSLESIVQIFQGTKANTPEILVYPAILLAVVAAMVLSLGVYQWLSAKSEKLVGGGE